MLAPKVDKKKNLINIIVISVIILIIIVVLLKSLVFKGGGEASLNNPLKMLNTEIEKVERVKVKKFDLDIFDNENFKNLKENKVKRPELEDLDVGKDDPFIRSE